jgi:N-acetylglutamate synthase-like GNAT family acetyltransferase
VSSWPRTTVRSYLQLVESDTEYEVELRGMAVIDQCQRKGIGRALVTRGIAVCRAEGVRALLVATASADTGNPRFLPAAGVPHDRRRT